MEAYGRGFVGSKYESGRDVTVIAKMMREDIKAAVAKGDLPKAKYSVKTRRFSGGQSIDIRAGGFPADKIIANPKRFLGGDREVGNEKILSEYGTQVREKLEEIKDSYLFDDSNSMTDYFHVNFYGSVDIEWSEQAEDMRVNQAKYGNATGAAEDKRPMAEVIELKPKAEEKPEPPKPEPQGPTKKKLVKIEIGFTEAGEVFQNKKYEGKDLIHRAENHLKAISRAKQSGGYDKTDVKLTWEDGVEYEARFDVMEPEAQNPDTDIKAHILGFMEVYSGRRKPAWMTTEQYENMMKVYTAEQKAAYAKLLDEYEVDG